MVSHSCCIGAVLQRPLMQLSYADRKLQVEEEAGGGAEFESGGQ